MAVCPKCNIEQDGEKNYCRNCGSLLLTETIHTLAGEEMGSKQTGKMEKKLICAKCHALYEIGNYCTKCGSLLQPRTEFQETGGGPLEKRLIKKWSKEWLRLFEEKKNLESCLSKLETQRDKISSDVLNPMVTRYQDQLEDLSSLHRGIETRLESVQKRASDEIKILEKELPPIQKRLEEIESLHRSGAMTQADFSREKKAMKKEIKFREGSLKEYRQIISQLPSMMGGIRLSSGSVDSSAPEPNGRSLLLHLSGLTELLGRARNLRRPLPIMIASGILILVVIGGYLLWHLDSPSAGSKPGETVASTPGGQESEKIRLLFENIRQANLHKNIDLFMACYSQDFKDRKEKRLATLKTWQNLDYLDLSYDLKKQMVTGDTADVKVEWLIRTSGKAGGQGQESRTVLDVTLRREKGRWKIKGIKSVS
jgi:hypothetical protein